MDHVQMLCIVAISAQAVQDLQSCAGGLVRLAPNEPESYVFATFAAAARGDRDAAYASIATARGLGLAPETADRLRVMVEQSEPPLYRWGKRLLVVFGAWLAGLGLLFVAGAALSGATLRFVRRLSPDPVARQEGSTLRSVYRALLHVASFYYYASLPLVLLLAVLLGAGVILGFLWVGHVPLYFVAVILSIVLYTVISVVKSLFARAKDLNPGLAVDLEKHHRLARVIDEVAKRVGTRRVDEVYLTPNTELAVLERGGFLRQMRGTTERCLVLGVGVLDGMKLGPFKAIWRTSTAIPRTATPPAARWRAPSAARSTHGAPSRARRRGGPYNPAWLFLVVFHKMFLRISQGASRLQEVMADRIAAFTYGPDAFARGLSARRPPRHRVRRALPGEHPRGRRELAPARQLVQLQARDEAGDRGPRGGLRKEILDRAPSPYDSHPKPADRVRWVRELTAAVKTAADDESDAWDLFASRVELEQILTAEVRKRLAQKGISVASPKRRRSPRSRQTFLGAWSRGDPAGRTSSTPMSTRKTSTSTPPE